MGCFLLEKNLNVFKFGITKWTWWIKLFSVMVCYHSYEHIYDKSTNIHTNTHESVRLPKTVEGVFFSFCE